MSKANGGGLGSKKELGFHNFMLGAKMTTKVLLDCLLCEMFPSPLHQFTGDLTMTRLALFPLNSLMAGFPGCHYQGGGDDGVIGWAQWGGSLCLGRRAGDY